MNATATDSQPSMEREISITVSRMSIQLFRILLSGEAIQNRLEETYPVQSKAQSESITVSVQQLIQLMKKYVENSQDNIFKDEISKALEALDISSAGLRAEFRRSQHSSGLCHQNIVKLAQDTRERAMRVLHMKDVSERRMIHRATEAVKKTTAILISVTSTDNLVLYFKKFVETIVGLGGLVGEWCQGHGGLIGRPYTYLKLLQRAMVSLRHQVSLISSAVQMLHKYPTNAEAQSKCHCAVGEMLGCVDLLMTSLDSHIASIWEKDEGAGFFIGHLEKLLGIFGCETSKLDLHHMVQLDLHLEALLDHSLIVASSCPLRHHNRCLIITSCTKLLDQWSLVEKLHGKLHQSSREERVVEEYKAVCKEMVPLCDDVERHLEAALLLLLVDVFKDQSYPLKEMMDTARLQNRPNQLFKDAVERFCCHAERVCLVARLIADSSSNTNYGEEILRNLDEIKTLNEEIVSITLVASDLSKLVTETSDLDQLQEKWNKSVMRLMASLDMATDSNIFIHLSELEMEKGVRRCKESINLPPHEIAKATRALIGQSHRVVMVIQSMLDHHTNPVFRHYLRRFISHLQTVTESAAASYDVILRSPEEASKHYNFHTQCSQLLKVIGIAKEVTQGKGQTELLHTVLKELGVQDPPSTEAILRQSDKATKVAVGDSSVNGDQKQLALKTYVSGLTRLELNDLTRAVTSASVAGHRHNLNQLCNDLLVRCNLAKEMTDLILATEPQDSDKWIELAMLSESVKELTPQLVDSARRVLDCDTYQIETMHKLAALWTSKMSSLEWWLRRITESWRQVADKFYGAIMMKDVDLTKEQRLSFEEHQAYLLQLVHTACSLCTTDTQYWSEQKQRLTVCSTRLKLLAQQLLQSADLAVLSASDRDIQRLRFSSLEWAAQVFATVHLIAASSENKLQVILGHNEGHSSDVLLRHQMLTDDMRKHMYLMKELLSWIDKSRAAADIAACLSKADDILNKITDFTRLTGNLCRSNLPKAEQVFSREHLKIMHWHWACEVDQTQIRLYAEVGDYSVVLDDMVEKAGAGDDKLLSKALGEFSASVTECISKVTSMSMVFGSPDKSEIHVMLEALERLQQRIKDAIISLAVGRTRKDSPGHKQLVLKWASRCHQLILFLSAVKDLKHKDVSDVRQLLTMPSTPITKLTSSNQMSHQVKAAPKLAVSSPVQQFSHPDVHFTSKGKVKDSDSNIIYKQLKKGATTVHRTPERSTMPKQTGPKVRFGHNQLKLFRTNPEFTGQWRENAMVTVAKEIGEHLRHIAQYFKARGPIKTNEDLFLAVKEVVAGGRKLVNYAQVLIKYCSVESINTDLHAAANHVDSLIAQYNILSNVKAATQDDRTSEKMLTQTAQNLAEAVNKLLGVAEACCIKGLQEPPAEADLDETDRMILSSSWKYKYDLRYSFASEEPTRDELGLKKVNHHKQTAALNLVSPSD